MVGDTGSFYNTPTTSALTGDTVRFIFSGLYVAPVGVYSAY